MPFDRDQYTIRRKVLQIFGASFHVYDPEGGLLGFSRQKAFKLREDIRVYADETQQREMLSIRARQVIDWSAAYDIVDSAEGRKVGAARRKGWSSVVRDSWELLDADDRPVARLQEDSTMLALLRRFLSNLIPQTYHLRGNDGKDLAELRVRFNPFVYKLDVTVRADAAIDRRLVLGVGVLLAAIEGRQQ